MDIFAVHFCPQCRAAQSLVGKLPAVIVCSACEDTDLAPITAIIDRDKWEWGQLTAQMFACLTNLGIDLTPRKARLLACAVASARLPSGYNAAFGQAIAFGEEWADTGKCPTGTAPVRERLGRMRPNDWARISERCLANVIDLNVRSHPIPELLTPILRDLVPNPFVPLTWNPNWFTSTVRDLAAHVYAAHDFGAMPVLADALQDAGCEDAQVLTHCRANKPHARGCWVLDAVLGKS